MLQFRNNKGRTRMRVGLVSAAVRRIGFALLLILGADFAAAQPYPSRPIRIVDPAPTAI
jgi:hypothetical protein